MNSNALFVTCGAIFVLTGIAIILGWVILRSPRESAIDYHYVGASKFNNYLGLFFIFIGALTIADIEISPQHFVFIEMYIAVILVVLLLVMLLSVYILLRRYYLPALIAHLYAEHYFREIERLEQHGQMPTPVQLLKMGSDMNCRRKPLESDAEYFTRILKKIIIGATYRKHHEAMQSQRKRRLAVIIILAVIVFLYFYLRHPV